MAFGHAKRKKEEDAWPVVRAMHLWVSSTRLAKERRKLAEQSVLLQADNACRPDYLSTEQDFTSDVAVPSC